MRWYILVARTEEMKNAYKILIKKCEGMTSFGGNRCKWEDVKQM
jgi:hypothetical protein